ncbi:MAG: UDP-N-acetylmuramoyl-L-alanine--D-glutamate ligase [Snowella sp.]|nr:UDP-N-acetylmuramoyl-L-alanine--D-glutamate ligase [Snowella sp.]
MVKATVIGLGRSGIAAARVLKRDGWDVTLSDRNNNESLQTQSAPLRQEGIDVQLGHSLNLAAEDRPDLIVVSPGVPWDVPVLGQARELGIDVIGEIELAWRHLKNVPWVGITGTNGKTTTTALTAAIFQAAGLNAPACGNIGYAACELFLQNQSYDWIIGEISSYQIESSRELAPKIGLWTTFTPDHLSRHKTLDNYYNIKASLLKRTENPIFNGDDAYLSQIGKAQWADAYWTSVKGKASLLCEPSKGAYLQDNWVFTFGELILPLNLFKMVGSHNHQNLLMAIAAARLAGIDKKAITEAIVSFSGVPHRLERICTFNGVDFINDSKATNYDAAAVGLASVDAPVILIAGGEAKEGDDSQWIAEIKAKAATVLLIGDAAPAFAQQFTNAGYNDYEIVETMANAVKRGAELAPQKGAKVVLLSPACASFDQYQSFEHRGDDFRALALTLV